MPTARVSNKSDFLFIKKTILNY